VHNLGFGMGASWEPSQDALKICDTSAETPKSMVILSSDQMNELTSYWLDGLCPICLVEIPLNDVVCDDCLDKAARRRNRK
jgi:hypothetical protein